MSRPTAESDPDLVALLGPLPEGDSLADRVERLIKRMAYADHCLAQRVEDLEARVEALEQGRPAETGGSPQ